MFSLPSWQDRPCQDSLISSQKPMANTSWSMKSCSLTNSLCTLLENFDVLVNMKLSTVAKKRISLAQPGGRLKTTQCCACCRKKTFRRTDYNRHFSSFYRWWSIKYHVFLILMVVVHQITNLNLFLHVKGKARFPPSSEVTELITSVSWLVTYLSLTYITYL